MKAWLRSTKTHGWVVVGVGSFAQTPALKNDDRLVEVTDNKIPSLSIWLLEYDEEQGKLRKRTESISEYEYNSLLNYGEILPEPPNPLDVYAPRLGEVIRDILNDESVLPLTKLKVRFFWDFLKVVVEL